MLHAFSLCKATSLTLFVPVSGSYMKVPQIEAGMGVNHHYVTCFDYNYTAKPVGTTIPGNNGFCVSCNKGACIYIRLLRGQFCLAKQHKDVQSMCI